MKKFLITFFAAFSILNAVQAQTAGGNFRFNYPDYYSSSIAIPSEFCYDDIPMLVLYSNNGNTISLYNENIELAKNIDLRDDFTYHYTLTYQDEERIVQKVNEEKKQIRTWSSYDAFIKYENNIYNGGNIEECFVTKELENDDKIISVDFTKYKNTSGVSEDNEHAYFAYEQYGFQYPLNYYYVEKNGSVILYESCYYPTYSEWKITGTRDESLNQNLNRIRLTNINLNNSNMNSTRDYFEVTQTLFNEDEKFEYIIPKLKLAKLDQLYPSYNEDDVLNPYYVKLKRSRLISDNTDLVLAGVQVVSEDGSVLKDLDFERDFEGAVDCNGSSTPSACVITIGKNTYLAFPGKKNGNDCTIFYKIDRTTSSIQQAKSVPAALMQIVPTIAKSGSEINVNFGDDNKGGSQIEVISASGAKVKSMNVPAGQKSAQFSVNGASGMYCVSRVQKDQPRETKKIIIK